MPTVVNGRVVMYCTGELTLVPVEAQKKEKTAHPGQLSLVTVI